MAPLGCGAGMLSNWHERGLRATAVGDTLDVAFPVACQP
jgi:hypothetical protein